jgi:hypothetical protein
MWPQFSRPPSLRCQSILHYLCMCRLQSAIARWIQSEVVLEASRRHCPRAMLVRTRFHSRLQFSWQDDPEAIVHKLVVLRNTARPPEPTNLFPHELRLIISGCRWVASSSVGSFWYEASDLGPKDVASFALLDTFTRWLPRWRGGILQVHTNDVCVMWGVRGTYSGLWHEVRALCAQYDVQLQARLGEQPSFNARRRDDYAGKSPNRALRDPEVVNAAVEWLVLHGKQGSAAYRKMLDHLRT